MQHLRHRRRRWLGAIGAVACACFFGSGVQAREPAVDLPIGRAPLWQVLRKDDKGVIEFESRGAYRKGDYTYVAVREREQGRDDAYVFAVHAFDCKRRRVSMATLGVMSLDGNKIEHGRMNSEALLAKYSSALPVPDFPHLTAVDKQVCGRK